MKEIEKLLLEHQLIEIDQQFKEEQIKSLMKAVETTNVINDRSLIRNIINQIHYIDKKSIFLQIILMIIGIWLTFDSPSANVKTTVNIISSIGAFLASVDLLETQRSYQYQMWEIEAACKNNLRELMMQRYLITGMLSIFIIIILSAITTVNLNISFVNLLLYFMVPFMFVCWSYLKLLKIAGNKVNEMFLLAAVLFLCGVIMIVLPNLNIYDLKVVMMLFVVMLGLYLKEMILSIDELKEGIEWN